MVGIVAVALEYSLSLSWGVVGSFILDKWFWIALSEVAMLESYSQDITLIVLDQNIS